MQFMQEAAAGGLANLKAIVPYRIAIHEFFSVFNHGRLKKTITGHLAPGFHGSFPTVLHASQKPTRCLKRKDSTRVYAFHTARPFACSGAYAAA